MEKLEFKNYRVQEMNSDELREKSGGEMWFVALAIVGCLVSDVNLIIEALQVSKK